MAMTIRTMMPPRTPPTMGNVSTFSTVVEDDRGFVKGRGVVVDRVDELDRTWR